MKKYTVEKRKIPSVGRDIKILIFRPTTLQNVWGGVAMHYDAVGTVCFIVKMLCVGFLEELIFRG